MIKNAITTEVIWQFQCGGDEAVLLCLECHDKLWGVFGELNGWILFNIGEINVWGEYCCNCDRQIIGTG